MRIEDLEEYFDLPAFLNACGLYPFKDFYANRDFDKVVYVNESNLRVGNYSDEPGIEETIPRPENYHTAVQTLLPLLWDEPSDEDLKQLSMDYFLTVLMGG